MTASCHDSEGEGTVLVGVPRIALVGSPNAGKTSVFNGLTGLHAKTGNYPGVTVSRFVGTYRVGEQKYLVEDLPGTYSLTPISPDEQITVDLLDGGQYGVPQPDALVTFTWTVWRPGSRRCGTGCPYRLGRRAPSAPRAATAPGRSGSRSPAAWPPCRPGTLPLPRTGTPGGCMSCGVGDGWRTPGTTSRMPN
jgi:hypothetical protein